MRLPTFLALLVLVAAGGLGPAGAQDRVQVKVVVVACFEVGRDTGDAPGEYQFWVEREHLNHIAPLPAALHPLRYNDAGLYGLVPGNDEHFTATRATNALMAFALDPHYDLRKTYWLFTGISGVDPKVASIGSAAWARWVVDGDAIMEIDDREIPAGWPYGLFASGTTRPNILPPAPTAADQTYHQAGLANAADVKTMAFALNPGLAEWAYQMTKNVSLPDNDRLKQYRQAWKGLPNAQRPPFVLLGESLGTVRYWYGARRTQWARDWVKLWTHGQGDFAMSNLESQSFAGAIDLLARTGYVDASRVLVLRSASDYSEPPPGIPIQKYLGDESVGSIPGFEAAYRVGSPVVHEFLSHWDKYKDTVPGAAAPVSH